MLNVRLGQEARERGQVIVFFALFIPVIFAIGAVVLDIGNWYVHKRHLQTQVDATALAPAREFTGCYDPLAWDSANLRIKEHSLGYSGDTKRPGVLGSNPSASVNPQVQQPDDVRVVLNSSAYWDKVNGLVPGTNGYGLDNTMDSDANGDRRFCDEKYIDVKATDDEIPLLWGLIPVHPSAKSHAKAALFWEDGSRGILPFAVPEVVPGAVLAIFVNEDTGAIIGSPTKLVNAPGASPTEFSIYSAAAAATFDTGNGLENVGVIILVSRADITNPSTSGSLGQICSQVGVRCYSGSGATSGLALVNIYKSGGPTPRLGRTVVGGCDTLPNYSPYFSRTGDCIVGVSAEIDFGALWPGPPAPSVKLYDSENCSGSGTDMNPDPTGTIWTANETLPEGGQAPFSIDWKAGPGGRTCFGRVAARPYAANGKSGPIEYLELTASGQPNSYSIPKDAGTVTYGVTVGLRPPLKTTTLSGKPVLIRYATEDDPSLTQSIDCDVDSYPYPAPFNTLPADVAEIAHGCVTPYKVNPTLDCSAYGPGDLPPAPPPTTTFANAPDCAQSKNGQVTSLQKGLKARLTLADGSCAPNRWPKKPGQPLTQAEIDDWLQNLGNDPRLVTLVVTEFAAFSGSGTEIIPIRYFAGFYITGKDISAQSPKCPATDPGAEDPHPLYGSSYPVHRDDGDVWGYYVVQVDYSSSGSPGTQPCDFTGSPRNCVLTLVE